MDTGKRQHLQDIYSTDRSYRDDYTPQVSADILDERKRQIRRHQFASFLLGMLVLILSVSLVYVVVREYIEIQSAEPLPPSITQGFIPRYSLPSESQWVLDFSSSYGDPKWDGKGERPFSGEWVRKAAFNLILAEQAASIGENEVAVEHYENALEIFPDIEGVRIPLGILYFKMEEFDKALALLEDTPASSLTPEVLNNLGAACLNAEAYDQAEIYLKQAIDMRAAYAEPQKNLAVLYKELGKENDAISAYETYIDLRPMDLDTQHDYALYLTKLGRWEQAADVLEGLVQEITDVPTLYFLLAQVEMHNDRPEKVIAALKRGMQLTDPGDALAYMDSSEFEQLRSSDEFQLMLRSLKQTDDAAPAGPLRDRATP